MQYSELGDIAQKYWIEIPNHFPFVNLGEKIVMPNHLHGIMVADDSAYDQNGHAGECCNRLVYKLKR